MTVDEDLSKLEDDIRRLKIEYEVYFSGGTPRPPHDTLFRVETMVKRYSSDQNKMNFGQRYRFTNLVQKYAVNSQLWRRKLQEKEEGRSLGGMRRTAAAAGDDGSVRVICSDPDTETEQIKKLLQAMQDAKKQVGETSATPDAATFHKFIKEKTKQLKESLGCDKVQFSVSIEDGKVKFKAAKAE